MCDVIYVLPTHDLAGVFSDGFKTHVFEQIPEASDAEDPDDFCAADSDRPLWIGIVIEVGLVARPAAVTVPEDDAPWWSKPGPRPSDKDGVAGARWI